MDFEPFEFFEENKLENRSKDELKEMLKDYEKYCKVYDGIIQKYGIQELSPFDMLSYHVFKKLVIEIKNLLKETN